MNNTQKSQLRQFFIDTFSIKIRNIRETYNALGVNNVNDAYKILDKEFKKFTTFITAEENKDKLQQIKKNAQTKAEIQFQQLADTIKQKEEISKKRKLAREENKINKRTKQEQEQTINKKVKTFELNDRKFEEYET
jgi:uncharacterized protein YqgV (UPF0045/DUF77 family)